MPPTRLDRVIGPSFGRMTGKEAWSQNLRLASIAASKVGSCLGPKGSYKMVTYNRGPELIVKVTKDSVQVMEELGVQYPAIKIISEAAKLHREHYGDGVCTFLILLAALMKEAERLRTAGVHPGVIVRGYNAAATNALKIIDEIAEDGGATLQERLLEIIDCGRGLLTNELRRMLINAVKLASKDGRVAIKRIRIVKKPGGATSESCLIRGVILKKAKAHPNMPDTLEKVKIALVSKRIDIKHLEIKMKGEGNFPVRLVITNEKQISKFKEEEQKLRMRMVEKLKSTGANVVVCRSPIADAVLDRLSRGGIFAIASVEQEDLESLSEATGAKIVGEVSQLANDDLGIAERVEVGKIELEDTVTFESHKGITLLLRGSSPESLDELERVVRNGILVLKQAATDGRLVPGGSAITMHIATALRKHALSFSGKEQIVVDAFANALEEISEWLARNYGLRPLDVLVGLRHSHSSGQVAIGVTQVGCEDMRAAGIGELAVINKAMISRTIEVVSLMLKVDHFVFAKEVAMVHKK